LYSSSELKHGSTTVGHSARSVFLWDGPRKSVEVIFNLVLFAKKSPAPLQ
jgi:hypothetical protein